MSDRFSKKKIKRGLLHFFVGKGVSALAGFSAMVAVIQGLAVGDFAKYSVLVALVEVLTAVSGLGLSHVVLRYVPEFYARYRTAELRAVVLGAFSIRTGVLVVLLGLCWLLAERFSTYIGLAAAVGAFQAFLFVVAFRSTAHFLSQILESSLNQAVAQAAFSASAVCRLAGMFVLMEQQAMTLANVIWVEAACDALSCLIMAVGVLRLVNDVRGNGAAAEREGSEHNGVDVRQISRFALSAYLQHLATLPFGGNTNRLVGGAMFGERVMASFGYAQSLYEYAKRYLPTQLLVGLIRPIVVARFASTRDFRVVAALCEHSLQANFLLLAGMLSVLAVAGPEILALLSHGKYGSESALLLATMLLLLALETQRVILEMLAQTVERYDILIASNLFLSTSVVGGIAGFPYVGAIAFPLANLIALLFANQWIVRRLAQLGYKYSHDWRATASSILLFGTAVSCGLLFRLCVESWIAGLIATSVVYAAFFIKVRMPSLQAFARDLMGEGRV